MSRTNKVFEHLEEHGPSTLSELPARKISYENRVRGVQQFHLRPAQPAGSTASGGPQNAVYYIGGEHTPEEVVDAFFAKNPRIADSLSGWSIHQRVRQYGKGFLDVSRERFGPFYIADAHGTGGMTGGTCPLCGEPYDSCLPNHLPCNG